MTNYPKVEYLDGPIIKDTKNILYQNFIERYCKQMQVVLNFLNLLLQFPLIKYIGKVKYKLRTNIMINSMICGSS
jgi:hypothetical protein